MDPRQYYSQPDDRTLSLMYQDAENSKASTGSPLRIFPFNTFPRTQPGQNSLTTPSSTNIIPANYSLASTMPTSQASQTWKDSTQNSANFDDHSTKDDFGYDSPAYITDNEHDFDFPRAVNFAGIPRSWEQYNPKLLSINNMSLETFEPGAYMIDPNRHNNKGSSSNMGAVAYNPMDNPQDFSQLSISRSPILEHEMISADGLPSETSTFFRLPSSEASDDGGNSSSKMTAVELDGLVADEPYAKLIYRALMSAPNHSMVLQEIYQWFRDNTTKGSSDTKGWMNSIRHNLSMNAAFRKTERKLSSDETKKSTEWVLEDFAIKYGVQSTTRYRKGTANKKFIKSENPAPNRQSSGRKGGISTSKASRHRQRRDEHSDPRLRIPRIDSARRSKFPHPPRPRLSQRQRSPLTPPHPESMASSPYYLPKVEQFETPYDGICGLEDVQGVHIDDSPVFGSNPRMQLNGYQAMSNHDHHY